MTATILSIHRRTETLGVSAELVQPVKNRATTHGTAPSDYQRRACSADCVSDPEIALLVSHALESALMALGEANPLTALGEENPEAFIHLRAYDVRREMRKAFEALPQAQATDPRVVKEYRRSITFQDVTLDLALSIARAIERYAKVLDQEASA
jgi:hypothetical protein